MEIRLIQPVDQHTWTSMHRSMLAFIRKHGGNHITAAAWKELHLLTPAKLKTPGTTLFLTTVLTENGPRLAGLSLVTSHGYDACIVVVHSLYRGRQLGSSLLRAELNELGSLQCKVAADNISSVNMCFKAGLTAAALIKGPTGKPTLVMKGSSADQMETKHPILDLKKVSSYVTAAESRNSYPVSE